MTEPTTYPPIIFYIIAIIGLYFLVKNPKYSFLLGIFYFAARENRMAALTRIEFFGPYLNLDDFVILLIIFSLIHFSFNRKIIIPSAVSLIAICIFSSILLIAVKYSFIYPVQREHKWALYFLLAIFLSYNFIEKEKDLEIFLKVLFIGCIVASVQYILMLQGNLVLSHTLRYQESIRSVGYISLIPVFLITSFFLKLKWLNTFLLKIIYITGLGLMMVNLILSQTRTIYIYVILTVMIISFLKKKLKFKSVFIILIVIPLVVYVIFVLYLGAININDIIFGRFELFSGGPLTDDTASSRLLAMKYEFDSFLSSNIIFGNGLGFTYFLPEAYNPYISWGHIGHIAYLSRLGLIGFLVYSIYIPFAAIFTLMSINLNILKNNYTKIFILFGSALVIGDWIGFWMSASYLGTYGYLPGTVIGIIWALKDKRIMLIRIATEKVKNELRENQHSNSLV